MARYLDITGQVFGKLTAVSDTGKLARRSRIWLFRCDCGELVERKLRDVRTSIWEGHTPMCKTCRRDQFRQTRRDITGQKFGKLTALRPTNPAENRAIVWEFQCECGRIVRTANLRKRSCGKRPCNPIAPLPGDQGAFNDLYREYRQNARRRGLVFELTKEQAREVFKRNCFYCGIEPCSVRTQRKEPFIYNGIDRLDNSLGYVTGNVVACCSLCNRAKSDLSYEEFAAWIQRLVNHNTNERMS